MLRAMLLPALVAVAGEGSDAGQEPGQDRAARAEPHVGLGGACSLVLPAGWRQLTPDEARELRRRQPEVPDELVRHRPIAYYPYGPVDGWLEHGFAGRCLLVARAEGEVTPDAEGIARIESQAADAGEDLALDRAVLAASVVELGQEGHPAIEVLTRLDRGDGTAPVRALELYVPSGGDTLMFAFRARERDFEAALPTFRATEATMKFARPPRGPRDLAQHLIYPAVVGGLIGLLILVLRKRTSS